MPTKTAIIPGAPQTTASCTIQKLDAAKAAVEAAHAMAPATLKDRNAQALAYLYYENELGRGTAANLLTRDEARRITYREAAAVVAKGLAAASSAG